MSQYGIIDSSKWALVGEAGLKPLSSASNKAISPCSGLPSAGYRIASNGNGASHTASWQGISLPTTPASVNNKSSVWEGKYFHSGTPVTSPYHLSYPNLSGGTSQCARDWRPSGNIPHHTLPHIQYHLQRAMEEDKSSYLKRIAMSQDSAATTSSVASAPSPHQNVYEHYDQKPLQALSAPAALRPGDQRSPQFGFPLYMPTSHQDLSMRNLQSSVVPNTFWHQSFSSSGNGMTDATVIDHGSQVHSTIGQLLSQPSVIKSEASAVASRSSEELHLAKVQSAAALLQLGQLPTSTGNEFSRMVEQMERTNGNKYEQQNVQAQSPSYQQISPTTTVTDANIISSSDDLNKDVQMTDTELISSSTTSTSPVAAETFTRNSSDIANTVKPATADAENQELDIPLSLTEKFQETDHKSVIASNRCSELSGVENVQQVSDKQQPQQQSDQRDHAAGVEHSSEKPTSEETEHSSSSSDLAPNLVVDSEMLEPITPPPGNDETNDRQMASENSPQTSVQLTAGHQMSHAVSRPPGLTPPVQPANFSGFLHGASGGGGFVCPICSFTSPSKFHFNSHMNTHTDHQCSMCDYRARTEGRLKRHMKDSHSAAEQAAAGVSQEGEQKAEPSTPITPAELVEQITPLQSMQKAIDHTISTPVNVPREMERKTTPSSSRIKAYNCKQCSHVSHTKNESWQHARSHIKPEKQLTCPQCLFVTEYKHHLEYHLRNHFGSKPFRCNKCSYACVNKSMLNSHMKSHSNVYQYRCADCTYATKYCHSLKLHLRKYDHRPGAIISSDGTRVDPSTLDLYGNRRGPGTNGKSAEDYSPPFGSPDNSQSGNGSPGASATMVNAGPAVSTFNPLMEAFQFSSAVPAMANSIATLGAHLPTISSLQKQTTIPSAGSSEFFKCNICEFRGSSQQELMTHSLMHVGESLISQDMSHLYGKALTAAPAHYPARSLQEASHHGSSGVGTDGSEGTSVPDQSPYGLDRSPPEHMEGSGESSGSPISGGKVSGDESHGITGDSATASRISRRKGKAFKLDQIAMRLQNPIPEDGSNKEQAEEGSQYQYEIRSQPPLLLSQRYKHSKVHTESRAAASYEPAGEEQVEEPQHQPPPEATPTSGNWAEAFICRHCEIAFKNGSMYHIHMGYHSYNNPFQCNRCGHLSKDSLEMFLHISQAKH